VVAPFFLREPGLLFDSGVARSRRGRHVRPHAVAGVDQSHDRAAANFLKDVNASGTLSLADKAITKANLTTALPPP
jgi:hypothetical protein